MASTDSINSQSLTNPLSAKRETSNERYRLQRNLRTFFSQAALIVLSAIFIIPFAWLVSTSFKPESQIFVFPPIWIPQPPTLRNYIDGVNFLPFGVYLGNTVFIALVSVAGTLLSCSLVAYGLSRIEWKGRNVLFAVLLGTLMIPFQVTMIPLFIIMKNLGWLDSYLPLYVPNFLAPAFFVFMLRQFFMAIPKDLTDAAKIDGASEFGCYWRIIMPLAKPALATVALFTFIGAWGEFLRPLIYLSSEDKYTLAIGLARFRDQYGSFWGQMMAVATLMTVPIIVLFFFTQRTFIQGISLSGIKG
jgi:multiple sugar transport system permease protein